jgi:hypothetical protein
MPNCILAEKLGYHGFYYCESLADIDLDCWTVIIVPVASVSENLAMA